MAAAQAGESHPGPGPQSMPPQSFVGIFRAAGHVAAMEPDQWGQRVAIPFDQHATRWPRRFSQKVPKWAGAHVLILEQLSEIERKIPHAREPNLIPPSLLRIDSRITPSERCQIALDANPQHQ